MFNPRLSPPSLMIKQLCDRIAAILLLILFSPIFLGISILIYLRMGTPVIFTQPRPGHLGRIFQFYKFRTMIDAYDSQGKPLPDDDRITPLGRFLRQSSLDELPQLWNVLLGEMSFVGPRPLRVRYLSRYSPEQARRHTVIPGITGLAQVNGRNAISWEEKFQLDVWYVDHWSLGLDAKILWQTVWKVLQREGISQSGYISSEEFMGSPEMENLRK